MMTPQDWNAEVARRITINEGCKLAMYHDTMGIPTIAVGFNLTRGDARQVLSACGVPDPEAVILGEASITLAQARAIFARDLPRYVQAAQASLASGVFNALSDARRFVVVDCVYNMGPGEEGWGGFHATHDLLYSAVVNSHKPAIAHAMYLEAADHLAASDWAKQVGNRAKRDIAMMRSSEWVDALGDGSQ